MAEKIRKEYLDISDVLEEMQIGEIVIWILSLGGLSEENLAEMNQCCDADRQEKTARIKSEQKRKQSIGAGYLLYLLKKKFGIDSEIIYLPNGKPVFKEDQGIQFSISHSGEWAALAYGAHPLGVDIEYVRKAAKGVARHFFTKEECEEVLNMEGADRERSDRERSDRERSDKEKPDKEKPDKEKPDKEKPDKGKSDKEKPDKEESDKKESERDDAFFRIWTGKEAIVKAAGTGLRISPGSFSVLPGEVQLAENRYALSGKPVEINGQKLWVSVAWELCGKDR